MNTKATECRTKLGWVGCVCAAYAHEVMGVSSDTLCVCVCESWRGWRYPKVMLTVHTQTAPEDSASLVDPLCMFCTWVCAGTWFWPSWSVCSGSGSCHFMQEGVYVCAPDVRGYFLPKGLSVKMRHIQQGANASISHIYKLTLQLI